MLHVWSVLYPTRLNRSLAASAHTDGGFRAVEMQDTTGAVEQREDKKTTHALMDGDEDEAVDQESLVGSAQRGEDLGLEQHIARPVPVHWPLQPDQVSIVSLWQPVACMTVTVSL